MPFFLILLLLLCHVCSTKKFNKILCCYRTQLSEQSLMRNVRIIADGLAQYLYNIPPEVIDVSFYTHVNNTMSHTWVCLYCTHSAQWELGLL